MSAGDQGIVPCHADGDRPAVGFCGIENVRGFWGKDFDGLAAKGRLLYERIEFPSGDCVWKRCGKSGGRSRKRKSFEIDASDDAERADRAEEKLVEVIAADILDDAAAALGERAVAGDEFHAKNEVARGAVELAQRRIDATG